MNVELMQALTAGWVSGVVAGMVGTAMLLVLIARRPQLASRLPLPNKLPVLGIVFANALTISLTLVGLVLGAIHHGVGGGGVLGGFSLIVLGGSAAGAGFYAFVRGGIRRAEAPAVLLSLAIVGLTFGLLMPWLATLPV